MSDEALLRATLFRPAPLLPMVPLDRASVRLALFPALLVLLLGAFRVPAEITGDHAGEFVTSAVLLGVPHSPGYPLWSMLAGLFAELPVAGTPAARVGMLSLVLLATSAFLITLWLRQLDVGRRAAVAAALFAAFGVQALRAGVLPGVHTLELSLEFGLLVLLSQFLASRRLRLLPAICAVAALGISHHPRFLLVAACAIALAIVRRPTAGVGLGRTRNLACAAAFAAGLAPLGWLLARGLALPYVNSGGIDGVAAVVRHWLGLAGPADAADYNLDPVGAPALASAGTLDPLVAIGAEHLWLVAPIAVLGLVRIAARSRLDAAALSGLTLAPVLFHWAFGELHPGVASAEPRALFLPAYALSACLSAVAIDWVLQNYGNAPRWRERLLTSLAAALALGIVARGIGAVDYGRYTHPADYAQSTLGLLPENSVLLTWGGNDTVPLLYHQGVLGERPDVTIIDRCGEIESARLPTIRGSAAGADGSRDHWRGGSERGARLLARLAAEGRPVFATRPLGAPIPETHVWRAVGLAFRLLEQGEPEAAATEEDERAWERIRFRGVPVEIPTHAHQLATAGAPLDATARELLALYYGALARRHGRAGRHEEWNEASRIARAMLTGEVEANGP